MITINIIMVKIDFVQFNYVQRHIITSIIQSSKGINHKYINLKRITNGENVDISHKIINSLFIGFENNVNETDYCKFAKISDLNGETISVTPGKWERNNLSLLKIFDRIAREKM